MIEFIIHEDELDLYENELILERTLLNSNVAIDLFFCEKSNSINDTNNIEKFKNMIHRIIESFKAFMIKCREYLKLSLDKITERISDAYRVHKLTSIFKNFNRSIEKAKAAGMKSFEFIDVKALHKCLDNETIEYERAINNFIKSYIKRASPKDAEKMLMKFNEISEKYDNKFKDIINEKKEYSITEAKVVSFFLSDGNNEFTTIVNNYINNCKDIERLTLSTLNSLNEYSEDTGYIQNAKTLQQMIHNSCVHIRTHSVDCMVTVIQYGVPIVCAIDKLAHVKTEYVGDGDDGIPTYLKHDTSSEKRKNNRKKASKFAVGFAQGYKEVNKALVSDSRKNDIKDWKYSNDKSASPLSFDTVPNYQDDDKIKLRR